MLESSGYYALGVPAYLILLVIERWLCRRQGLSSSGLARSICNVSGGLGGMVVGLFLAPVLIGLYVFGFEHLALIHWPEGSIVPWILALFLGDLCYYLNHRAGHRIGVLWAIHGVHHQCDEFDYTVAMRHPWFADTYAVLFYVPLPLLGVPPLHFFLMISVISFFAFLVHTRSYDFPSFGILVTPRSHIVHHCKNPRYIGRNMGAMFTIWDRVFGTHAVLHPDDPPDLGPPGGYRTHDGALSQWIYFGDMLRMARAAGSWRDRLRVLFARPGWRPDGVAPPDCTPARPEREIRVATRVYSLVQFAIVCTLAVYVLWLRDQHPLFLQVAATVAILWCIITVGGLLDGRRQARRAELMRLGGLTGIAVLLILSPPYAPLGGVLLALSLLGAVWLLVARIGPGTGGLPEPRT